MGRYPRRNIYHGNPKGEMEREKNETQHQVTLSAFKMSESRSRLSSMTVFARGGLAGKNRDYFGLGKG